MDGVGSAGRSVTFLRARGFGDGGGALGFQGHWRNVFLQNEQQFNLLQNIHKSDCTPNFQRPPAAVRAFILFQNKAHDRTLPRSCRESPRPTFSVVPLPKAVFYTSETERQSEMEKMEGGCGG